MRAAAPAAVTALRHSPRRGKAEAVRAGILAGARASGRQLVGFFDADLSTPLAAIDDFLAVLAHAPGRRVRPRLARDADGPRRQAEGRAALPGRVFATAVSLALDLPVYDTQCGAKMLRVNAATATLFAAPFRSRWIFDVELIARYLRLPVAPGEPAAPRSALRAGAAGLARQARVEAALVRLRPRDGRPRIHLARARRAPSPRRRGAPRVPRRVTACPEGHEGRPGEHTMSNEKQPSAPGVAPQVHGHRRRRGRDHDRAAPRARRRGFQAPSDTVNVAVVGYAHGMGTSNLMNVAKSDNIVALCDCDESDGRQGGAWRSAACPTSSRRRCMYKDFRADAREAEGHRRGRRRHARSQPRRRRDGRDAARQARLRAEAADAHDQRGAGADRGGAASTRSSRRWATRATPKRACA